MENAIVLGANVILKRLPWGDMYKDPGDYDQAESIYRMVLDRNVAGKEDVLERLEMLEEETRPAGVRQGLAAVFGPVFHFSPAGSAFELPATSET